MENTELEKDALFEDALKLTAERGLSQSMLQRHLKVGYKRSLRLIEQIEIYRAEHPQETTNSVEGKREVGKLELRHVAPYLPYELRYYDETDASWQLDGIYTNGDCYNNFVGEFPMEFCKPILRPLSDLTKEQAKKFYQLDSIQMEFVDIEDWIQDIINGIKENDKFQLRQWQLLFEWHFDVFGLIEKNLAIDINTLNL